MEDCGQREPRRSEESTDAERELNSELEKVQAEKLSLERRLLAQGALDGGRSGALWNRYIEEYYRSHKLQLLKHTNKGTKSVMAWDLVCLHSAIKVAARDRSGQTEPGKFISIGSLNDVCDLTQPSGSICRTDAHT